MLLARQTLGDNTYDLSDPLVAQLGNAMGMSDTQLDALWQAGPAL